MSLTFDQLRKANVERNRAHFQHEWDASKWVMALIGELGEAANILKKVERGDFPLEDVKADVAHELADVQAYLDLLADHLDIDLGKATVEKFNIVSDRIGSTTTL